MPGIRKGPLKFFPHNPYKNWTVVEVMKKDPYYFMVQVKHWLDISPYQADKFAEITNGGEIPSEFIKNEAYEDDTDFDSNRSFDEILEKEWYDFDNQVWRNKETGEILYQKV